MPLVALPASTWDVPVPVSVTTLPTVPVTVHLPKVCVVVPSAIVYATVLIEASSVNVLSPVMLIVGEPATPPIVSLLYDSPPPANVRAEVVVSDKTMFAVPLKRLGLLEFPRPKQCRYR